MDRATELPASAAPIEPHEETGVRIVVPDAADWGRRKPRALVILVITRAAERVIVGCRETG